MLISFESLLKIFPRFASIAPLKRLTFDHLLCPAISGFPDRDCLTSKIPKNTSRTADVRNYQAVLKPSRPTLSIQLSGPICSPFSGGGVEDLLPKAQRFRRRFDILIDVDVLEGAFHAHPERGFQLNAFAFALAAHVGQALRLARIDRQIFWPRIFADDHSFVDAFLRPDEQAAALLNAVERVSGARS